MAQREMRNKLSLKDSLSALPLWDQFRKAARERGCSLVRLLTEYLRERLESWEDQQLDEAMRRSAQRVS
jgi:hypothetical protein